MIQPGDMLWVDFGITYLGLNTDTQHLAYVLRPGERDAPAGLRAGLAAANRAQDARHRQLPHRPFRQRNPRRRPRPRRAPGASPRPSIRTRSAITATAPAPSIGFWDNQAADPRGAHRLRANTAWSIELNVRRPVPEWGGQEIEFRLEEDAFSTAPRSAISTAGRPRFT